MAESRPLTVGGVASGTVVRSGRMLVLEGGSATSTTFDPGAILQITFDTAVSGYQVGSGFTLDIADGGSATATTVSSGGTFILESGGTAVSTTFLAGATFEIVSGLALSGFGVARGITVEVGTSATATSTTGVRAERVGSWRVARRQGTPRARRRHHDRADRKRGRRRGALGQMASRFSRWKSC